MIYNAIIIKQVNGEYPYIVEVKNFSKTHCINAIAKALQTSKSSIGQVVANRLDGVYTISKPNALAKQFIPFAQYEKGEYYFEVLYANLVK